jgi:hypothetical protein
MHGITAQLRGRVSVPPPEPDKFMAEVMRFSRCIQFGGHAEG